MHTVSYTTPMCFGAIISPSSASWNQSPLKHTAIKYVTMKIHKLCYHHNLLNSDTTTYVLLWPISFQYILKKFWCQLLEGGKTIASKHVEVMQKVVSINYRIVQLSALHEWFTIPRASWRQREVNSVAQINEGTHCFISMLMGMRFCEQEVRHGKGAT